VKPELWTHILTPAERADLESREGLSASDMASVVYGAKEAFYKCQYPLTRQWLDFADVVIRCSARTFEVHPQKKLTLEAFSPSPWIGRFTITPELVVAGLAIAGANERAALV